MRVQLDTPNAAIPKDELDKIDTNNVLKLQQTINKTGVNSTLNVESTTETNFTNASLATAIVGGKPMQGVITSSGGFYRVYFKSTVLVPNGGNFSAALLVDSKIVDTAAGANGAAADLRIPVVLEYNASLGAGRHNLEVQVAISAGTAKLSSSSTYSRLQAIETVL